MKKNSNLARVLFYGIMFGYCSSVFASDESIEPPQRYTVKLNGVAHEVMLDDPITLNGQFNNPKVELSASNIRQFTYGDIEFDYPASLVWESDIDDQTEKSWTLTGNDFTFMYFILPSSTTTMEFAEAMAEQFGKQNTIISDKTREIGSNSYQGKLLFVKLAGINVNLELYSLPAKSGARLMVFQDTPPENRALSIESEKAIKMFTESFVDIQ